MQAFDTHTYVKELQAVGVTEAQAEVQANTLKTLLESDLATKRDLKELEIKMETRFKELESNTKTRLKELELHLTLRLGGMLVIGIGVITTLIKLL